MPGSHSPQVIKQVLNDEVSKSIGENTPGQITSSLGHDEGLFYIRNSTYNANPTDLLGLVFVEWRAIGTLEPRAIAVEVEVLPTASDAQVVGEFIVKRNTKVNSQILSILNVDIAHEDLLEVRMINNMTARAMTRGPQWVTALDDWKAQHASLINDPNVQSLSVVTGVVQTYISTKKYTEWKGSGKGGGFGVNVGGDLFMSDLGFTMFIIYGLDLVAFHSRAPLPTLAAPRDTEGGLQLEQGHLATLREKFANLVTPYDDGVRAILKTAKM